MKVERFEWGDARAVKNSIRHWATGVRLPPDVESIAVDVLKEGDAAVLALTARLDATEQPPDSLRIPGEEGRHALAGLAPDIRRSLELAAANIRAVALAQLGGATQEVDLPQGQKVTLRDVPVRAAGIYAPGGRAAYPSSVLMCCIPAQVAGVERVALASPPGPAGRVHPLILAAAALCEVDEIYAMGGAQAIFALAYGTETIDPVDVVAGPGNAWVREAKRSVSGETGIDSLAGPSELMLIAGAGTNPEWAAFDICAQAEHGDSGPLIAVSVDGTVLDRIAATTEQIAAEHPAMEEAPLALVQAPDLDAAIDLANAFAPEHLELLDEDAALLAERVTTAGCVFVGPCGATAFGDYVAGSNHVLPTGGAGRFSGPLGPDVFRRKIATVEVSGRAAAKLAPHVKALAEAEGFPVHAESAMIRTGDA